jgi:DNA polymerase-3 subunit epsilon
MTPENIVFTGTLSTPRNEMKALATKAGHKVLADVTKSCTLLVVGPQNLVRTGGYDTSSKQRHAEMLIKAGQDIRIVTEAEFLALCGK